ncbi:hypothetical protein EMIT0357P_10548 [Pseudomonas marginalis]
MAGITAMNGTPSSRAKYASEIAVEPLDASMTGAPGLSQPLHSAYRNSERASRCFRLPVGWLDSSLKYNSMPGRPGSGNGIRCVSALRWKSASMMRMASRAQGRWSLIRKNSKDFSTDLRMFPTLHTDTVTTQLDTQLLGFGATPPYPIPYNK